tara:strand:+ start:63 stop:458 length:396 start_codon:yes stop_codon:yes gene_type:complete
MEGNGYNPMKIEFEKLIEENKKLKKRVEEVQGENTIIKGIGNNSPEMKNLKEEVSSLNAQLKEKDLQIEQEVLYKMEERKKWETLSNDNHQLKKQLGFHLAFNKTGKDKVLDLIKVILEFYGEKLEQKKPH